MTTDLLLLGDPHMLALRQGAERLGIAAVGGPLMPAGLLNHGALGFDESTGMAFVPVANSGRRPVRFYRNRFEDALTRAGIESLATAGVPVITNLGTNPLRVLRPLKGWTPGAAGTADRFISRGAMRQLILAHSAEFLKVVAWLARHLPRVICVTSPPRTDEIRRDNWVFCEEVMRGAAEAAGARFVSSLDWAEAPGGGVRDEYLTGQIVQGIEDRSHGNAEYGTRLMQECLTVLDHPAPPPRLDGAAGRIPAREDAAG